MRGSNLTFTVSALLSLVVSAALVAQNNAQNNKGAAPKQVSAPPKAAAVAKVTPVVATPATPAPNSADAAKYRAWVNKNCVGCHNAKSLQPANDPVNLEAASLDDLLGSAGTWERVLRKLSVRAMPPPG